MLAVGSQCDARVVSGVLTQLGVGGLGGGGLRFSAPHHLCLFGPFILPPPPHVFPCAQPAHDLPFHRTVLTRLLHDPLVGNAVTRVVAVVGDAEGTKGSHAVLQTTVGLRNVCSQPILNTSCARVRAHGLLKQKHTG